MATFLSTLKGSPALLVTFFLFCLQSLFIIFFLYFNWDTFLSQSLSSNLKQNCECECETERNSLPALAEQRLPLPSSSSHDYSQSLKESNGWIKQEPSEWERYKKIFWEARKRQNRRPDLFWRDIHFYMNYIWLPEASCPTAVIRVGTEGDGGKMICDPYRLQSPDCLVYSVGSNGDFSFEDAIRAYNPKCEIHTFDHTWNGKSPSWLNFHHIGIGMENKAPIKTIGTILKELGHLNRRIDIFKIDCDGCEFDIYPNFYMEGVDIRQLLIEVHFKETIHKKAEAMFWGMMDNGFVMFAKEPNLPWGCGEAGEFSFLRFNPKYFHLKLPDGTYPHNYPEIEPEHRHKKNGDEKASGRRFLTSGQALDLEKVMITTT